MGDLGDVGVLMPPVLIGAGLGALTPKPLPYFSVGGAYWIGPNLLRDHSPVTFASGATLHPSHVHIGERTFAGEAMIDEAEGNPEAPCQRQPLQSVLRDLLWLVEEGTNILSLDVQYAGTPPRMILKQDASLGLATDVILSPATTTDWTTISTVFTSPQRGVVRVWRQRLDNDLLNGLFWDNLRTRVV